MIKNNSATAQKVAEILLDIKAIFLNAEKPFRYASGILSPIYTDCRILMSYPKERGIVRDFYIDRINETGIKFDVIAGTATAGIPHAAWIAEKLQLPMAYVRNKSKDHGKGNQIEGVIKKGQRVAVIEDLISTGESSVNTARAVREQGGITENIFAIFTYDMKKAEENFILNNIRLISLTNFQTVVETAFKNGSMNNDQKKIILDWTSDPSGWGKKMGFE